MLKINFSFNLKHLLTSVVKCLILNSMKELKELLKSGLTKETIAARLRVSTRSIERWRDGIASPRARDRLAIHKMYNRMLEKQVEASHKNAFNS